MTDVPKRSFPELSPSEKKALAETRGRLRLEDAVKRAVHEPCRIVLHDGGAKIFITRLYDRIREEVAAGRVPVGVYRVAVMVGSRFVPLDVTVQADLFGPSSVVIDHTALDRLEAKT